MMKILFQGDSITDAGRDRRDMHDLGNGYPKYAAEYIRNRHAEIDFEFIDLGIGGDRTCDLCRRWQSDAIDIAPDVISILIGINDTCHCDYETVPDSIYEENYRKILSEIKDKTNAKIIILEQFLIYWPAKAHFRADVDSKIQITRRLAREYADVFIPLDGIFASHGLKDPSVVWTPDGIHPNDKGAELIAEYYAAAFDKIFPLIS